MKATLEHFLTQNYLTAATLNDEERRAAEPYVRHYSGGLVVLLGETDHGTIVKMHDSWGGGLAEGEPGDIVVHEYPADDSDDGLVTWHTGSEIALADFLARVGGGQSAHHLRVDGVATPMERVTFDGADDDDALRVVGPAGDALPIRCSCGWNHLVLLAPGESIPGALARMRELHVGGEEESEPRPGPVTLTIGDLIRDLQALGLPDDTPVIGYNSETGTYLNLPFVEPPQAEDIAVMIDVRDDYDTRQW